MTSLGDQFLPPTNLGRVDEEMVTPSDSAILLDSAPLLRKNTPGGGQGPSTSLFLPPTSPEDLRLDGYLEYNRAAKALYIYKHPCLLRDSNPGPTAQQPASLYRMGGYNVLYTLLQLQVLLDMEQ
ncbi:uncharacterized protein TNCV_4170321 [Trichonephila clavipes]|nr:uncharacterized protein TNCV_4170321 [Trichonephila clavipes]